MPVSRPFNLVRRFSLLALVCVVSISAALAHVLSDFLTEELLHRDAVVTQDFVQSVAVADKAAAYFPEAGRPARIRELEETFKHYPQIPDVLRANVFAHDRRIIWSSDGSLTGRQFTGNDELDAALDGRLVVKSGLVRKPEHVAGSSPFPKTYFVEIYIPIWDESKRGVVGVVEIYKTPAALSEAINSGRRLIWTNSALGGLFLYIMLFWIVQRADRVMREQRQRLVETETLAAVGEMAGAVAHAIRNPLAAIRSSAELALDAGSGPSTEQADDIIAEVDRVERSVRELLTYSRPPSERLEKVELNEVIRRSVGGFSREIEKRGIATALRLEDSLPAVRGDPALLGQVFSSVIANALDAMPTAGALTVSTRAAPDRARVQVTISDTGIGIPAHELDNVLKPFHTTKAKGLGLGLPLARRILERHGGSLAISSGSGSGTTVNVELSAA